MFIFDKQVFVPSAAFLLLLVGLSALSPEAAGNFFQSVQNAIVAYGSWYYVLVVAVILIVVTILTFTKFGDIKLGPDHSEPDYSFISWFAMLFSAGMGIGLMFLALQNPSCTSSHHLRRTGLGSSCRSHETYLLHWGIHAWAMYAIVA